MNNEQEQLLTQSEVAARKDMTLPLLAHHLAKPDAPEPVERYGKKLYRVADVDKWKPRRAK